MPARRRNGGNALKHVRHGVQHQLGLGRHRHQHPELRVHEAALQEAGQTQSEQELEPKRLGNESGLITPPC